MNIRNTRLLKRAADPSAAIGPQPFTSPPPAGQGAGGMQAAPMRLEGRMQPIPPSAPRIAPGPGVQMPDIAPRPLPDTGQVAHNGMMLSPQEVQQAQMLEAQQAQEREKQQGGKGGETQKVPDTTPSEVALAAIHGQLQGIKGASDASYGAGTRFSPVVPGEVASNWVPLSAGRAPIDAKKHPTLAGLYDFVRPLLMQPLLQRYAHRGVLGNLESRAHRPWVRNYVRNYANSPLSPQPGSFLQGVANNLLGSMTQQGR